MIPKRIKSDNFKRSNKENRNIGKMNDWMAPQLFRILVVALIFSWTVPDRAWKHNQLGISVL